MTPIGHTLTGLAIGYAAIPRDTPPQQKMACLAGFALLASLPDLPLPYWGHGFLDASHSLVSCTIGVLVIGSFLLWKYKGRFPFTPTMIVAGALCWYSHMLLDSMYSWGVGLPIAWPFGMVRLALPVPWLQIADKADVLSLYNVKVAMFEILTFGPLLLLAVLVKHARPRRTLTDVPTSSSESRAP
jgi:hypothetical protein